MSDEYWHGNLREGARGKGDFPHGSQTEAPTAQRPNGASLGPAPGISSASVPEPPLPSAGGHGAYWKGTYDDAEGEEGVAHGVSRRGGSVSAPARKAYAAEALRQKDHVAAALLAFFLGVFGVHKFYLGCNQAGFIMLAVSIIGGILTFGLAAAVIEVISVIEGIIYLTKPQTDFNRIYVLHQRDWF